MNAIVWCSWVNSAAGGFERVAFNIANGLAARSVDVTLVGPYSNAPAILEDKHPRLRIIEHQTRPTVASIVSSSRTLRALVEELKADVISAHGSVFPLLPLNVPVVWTEHAIRYPNRRMLAGPKGLLWRAVRERLVSGRWQSVCVSNFVLKNLRNELRLPQHIGRVIFNGVPQAEKLTSLAPPAMKPPYRIGVLGRLERDKRPFDVFDIDLHLQRLGVPCEWHIFGDGSLGAEMRARAAAHAPGRVHIRGYIEEIRDAFAQIDMLCLPSQLEGLPTVCLEARMARRLVAGWAVAGIPEAAGDHGVLAEPPFDASRLAETMAAALLNGARPPMSSCRELEFGYMLSCYESALRSACGLPSADDAVECATA